MVIVFYVFTFHRKHVVKLKAIGSMKLCEEKKQKERKNEGKNLKKIKIKSIQREKIPSRVKGTTKIAINFDK